MGFIYQNKNYRSKKHPMLEKIFNKKNPGNDTSIHIISFTLKDISDAYRSCNIPEPASISNTILDLTRRNNPITSRLPESIINLGYDLRKRTGKTGDGNNYAGEFVYVGKGKSLMSWLEWPDNLDLIRISSKLIPYNVLKFLRNDEGGLFSVIDYCDIFSKVFKEEKNSTYRIQNPLKWQPNELDGFYFRDLGDNFELLPVEAKALSTNDDINLFQLKGQMETVSTKFYDIYGKVSVRPIVIKGVVNGINIGIMESFNSGDEISDIKFKKLLNVIFDPPIINWT